VAAWEGRRLVDSLTSLKLDARTKHFAQIVARASGLSFGELLKKLLDEYLATATLEERGRQRLVSELMDESWSEHEADRIALIGNRFPEALTERQRVLWQNIICESARYWCVPLTGKPIRVTAKTFHFENFRADLPLYDGVTRNEMIVQVNEIRRQKSNVANWPKKERQ
jgi:hypothetical protein